MDDSNKNNQQNEIKKSTLRGSYLVADKDTETNKSNENKNIHPHNGCFVTPPGSGIIRFLEKIFKK